MSVQMTPGMQMNRMLDQLGLPDTFGDMMGAMLDARVGNQRGVMMNLLDGFSGLATSQFQQLFGQSISPFGFAPRPHVHWERHTTYHKHTYYQRHNLRGSVSGREVARFLSGPRWARNAIGSAIARNPGQIEKLIKTNPRFKAYMERKLGGKIQWDPVNGGIVTLKKTKWVPHTRWRARIHWHANNFLNRLGSQFAGALNRLSSLLTGPIGSFTGGLLQGLQGASAGGGAPSAGAAGSAGSAGGDLGQIMNDPNMSIEDKLVLLLAKFAEKKMKELEDKVNQMSKAGKSKKKGGIFGGKGGGIFGKLGSVFKGLAGGILNLGGGLLGGLIGGPIGALGKGIGGALGNIFGGLGGAGGIGGAGGAGGAGGTGGAGGAGGAGGKQSETMLQAQIQLLSQKMQRAMQTLSNLMKAFHSAMSTSIQNIR